MLKTIVGLKNGSKYFIFFFILISCTDKDERDINNLVATFIGTNQQNFVSNRSPTAPSGLKTKQSGTIMTLNWAPSRDIDGRIEDYEVSINNGVTWSSSGRTDLKHEFKNLTVGTTYKFEVRAKDDKGSYSSSTSIAGALFWIKETSLGGEHSFLNSNNGKLYVFGENGSGQLGLNDTTDRLKPIELTNSTETISATKPLERGKVKRASLGGEHSFVEMTDGKLYVFGENGSGQLGLGDTTDKNVPTELTIASTTAARPLERGKIKRFALGGTHSFVEMTDGKLYVFGENGSGQLGLGDTTDKNVPTELTVATATAARPLERGKIKRFALGGTHSFVETTDGRLYVFGENGSGQLGLNDTTDKSRPTELTVATADVTIEKTS